MEPVDGTPRDKTERKQRSKEGVDHLGQFCVNCAKEAVRNEAKLQSLQSQCRSLTTSLSPGARGQKTGLRCSKAEERG